MIPLCTLPKNASSENTCWKSADLVTCKLKEKYSPGGLKKVHVSLADYETSASDILVFHGECHELDRLYDLSMSRLWLLAGSLKDVLCVLWHGEPEAHQRRQLDSEPSASLISATCSNTSLNSMANSFEAD